VKGLLSFSVKLLTIEGEFIDATISVKKGESITKAFVNGEP